MKILFVCSANACRSPMAEGIARKLLHDNNISTVKVDSSGLDALAGMPATDETIETMKARGVDLTSHRSKVFRPNIGPKDMVLTMTRSQKERILSKHPFLLGRVFTLSEYAKNRPQDLEDPSKGEVSYEEVADEIESSVRLVLGLPSERRK